MKRKISDMSFTELLIAYDTVNRKLDRIKNDPDYIKEEVNRVFGDKQYVDHEKVNKDLTAILAQF